MNRRQTRQVSGLVEAILLLRNTDEGHRFLTDLCTVSELKTLANRWEAARMLEAGLTYEAIETKTRMSSATISRIRRALSEGTNGYRLVLARQKRTAAAKSRAATVKKAASRPAAVRMRSRSRAAQKDRS